MTLYPWEPDYVIHPGETLKEALEERGLSQADLARATGFTAKHINMVVMGNTGIGIEFALALETALGINARVWLNLQMDYDLGVARGLNAPSGGERRS